MNIKVAAFTVSEKSINTSVDHDQLASLLLKTVHSHTNGTHICGVWRHYEPNVRVLSRSLYQYITTCNYVNKRLNLNI